MARIYTISRPVGVLLIVYRSRAAAANPSGGGLCADRVSIKAERLRGRRGGIYYRRRVSIFEISRKLRIRESIVAAARPMPDVCVWTVGVFGHIYIGIYGRGDEMDGSWIRIGREIARKIETRASVWRK